MAWNVYRRGRHLSIQLPVEVKNQLVRNKARGGGTLTEQIVSALQSQWSGAVQQQNSVPPQRLAPSSHPRELAEIFLVTSLVDSTTSL
jgi:hypothetical protein